MFALRMGSISALSILAAWSPSCANKSDDDCDCTYNHALPQPTKILRKGSGFSPISYSFSLDLLTGNASYEKLDELNTGEPCNGNLNVSADLIQWKEAVQLVACTRVLKNPISDGFIDAMVLYYPNSEMIPNPLETKTDGDSLTVEIQENIVDSVAGRQQFDCSGHFAIDTLIKAQAECLGIE